MSAAQIRIALQRCAENLGKLGHKLISCKPHEVTSVILAQEAIRAEMSRLGHQLQEMHDRALAVCP